jgi:tartrate-resistant acid phosphatase type 5
VLSTSTKAMASFNEKSMNVYFIFTIIFGLGFLQANAELQKFTHTPKPDGSLSFLVVGDWGRRGEYNQSDVALQVRFIFSYRYMV